MYNFITFFIGIIAEEHANGMINLPLFLIVITFLQIALLTCIIISRKNGLYTIYKKKERKQDYVKASGKIYKKELA